MSSGRPSLDDRAGVHEHRPRRDLAGEAHLVGDDQHRRAGLGEAADGEEHLLDELRIERRGHLVEEEQARLHGERPGDGDALLLAAGKRRGIVVAPLGEADAVEPVLGDARAPRPSAGAAPWSGRA